MGNAISPHVDEVRLLAYADDQLAPSEAAAVGTHVLGCAGCRTRLEELRGDLEEYVRDHHPMWKRLLPPPKPWPDLAPRLHRLDAPRRMPWRRSMTWAAAAAGIAVAVAGGYRLSTDRTVIVSEPALPKAAPLPSVASVPGPKPAAPVTAGPAEELRVLAALNRLGADLGEPVEVTRDAAAVRVSGLGIEAARRQQILDSLAGIPGVIVRFEEPQPVRLEAAPVSAPAAIPENALHNRLEAQLGGRAMLDRFINQALDQSEAALSRAHAILNLAQRFPPAVEQSLSSADRELLGALRRRHTAALAASSAQLTQWLAPLLGAAAPVSPAPCGVWQECAATMLEATQVFDRELNSAIAGGNPGEQQLPELRKHLAHWQEAVAAYQASTGSANR